MTNPITVVGNLTRDPELRFLPGDGTPVTSVDIAVNDRKFNRSTGQYEDAGTTYWRANAFRALAENIAESLSKGDQVIVTGSVKDRTFETKDGDKRTVKEIEVSTAGPSLRFASAKVSRTPREHGSAPAQGAPTADPWSEPAANEVPF